MKPLQFTVLVNQGKLPTRISQEIDRALKIFDGKRVVVSLEEEKRTRTNPQNRFCFGAVIRIVRAWFATGRLVEARVH